MVLNTIVNMLNPNVSLMDSNIQGKESVSNILCLEEEFYIGQLDLALLNFFHKVLKQQLKLGDQKMAFELVLNSLFKKILIRRININPQLKKLLAIIGIGSVLNNLNSYNRLVLSYYF